MAYSADSFTAGEVPTTTKWNKLWNNDADFDARLIQAAPVGEVTAYAGSSAPTGWLICDGSAVSRTTYATLFAIIGTVFGAGDGSTTFNLPNAKGSVIAGKDSAQTEFDVIGEVGGAKTHSHRVVMNVGYASSAPYGMTGDRFEAVVNNRGMAITSKTVENINRGAITTPTNNNLEMWTQRSTIDSSLSPYIVLNYIIKT